MLDYLLKDEDEIMLEVSGDLHLETEHLKQMNMEHEVDSSYISIDNASFLTIFCC